MPFTKYAIDTFISEKITELTECNVENMRSEYPESEKWVSTFMVAVIMMAHVSEEHKHFVIQFIRKVEMCFDEYHLARETLKEYVKERGNNWSKYFRVLNHLESSIAQLYQAYDLSRKKLGTDLFKSNDGSSLDRLNKIYNTSKHQPAFDEQTVWVTNSGIGTQDVELSFSEIEAMLRECASITKVLIEGKNGLNKSN